MLPHAITDVGQDQKVAGSGNAAHGDDDQHLFLPQIPQVTPWRPPRSHEGDQGRIKLNLNFCNDAEKWNPFANKSVESRLRLLASSGVAVTPWVPSVLKFAGMPHPHPFTSSPFSPTKLTLVQKSKHAQKLQLGGLLAPSPMPASSSSSSMTGSPPRPPSPVADRPRRRPVSRACDRCRRRKAKVSFSVGAFGRRCASAETRFSRPAAEDR